MIRNAKVGERVLVLGKQIFGHEVSMNRQVISRWPQGCAQGTITQRWLHYNQSPTLWVTPDHPDGVGETRFRPSELERLVDLFAEAPKS